MKLINLLFTFCIFSAVAPVALLAQKTKPVTVAVSPFEYSRRTADPTYVSMIYDHVSFVLSQNTGVQIAARDIWDKLEEERDLMKTEPFILSETVEQGRSAGAEKLLAGKVYMTDIRREGEGYSISFSFYLAVVDLETGIVEDNIMLSPKGIEDSDKMIKVLKKLRPFANLPRTFKLINKMIAFMELFDLAATYEIGGLSQNDSFEEALAQMDKELIPFLEYHFDGQTNAYTPSSSQRTEVKEKGKSKNKKEEGSGEEGGGFLKKFGKDKKRQFSIISMPMETQLEIDGTKADKIKKNTEFHLVEEVWVEEPDWNNVMQKKMKRVKLAELSFLRYAGDVTVIEMKKKNEFTLNEILQKRKEDSKMYVMFKLDNY